MKKQSVLPSIVLVTILAISMLGFQFWTSHSVEAQETSLKVVNPLTGDRLFNFTDAEKSVGDTFIVNITVVDVTGLYGWQIKFSWDASLLDFVSAELPSDHVFAGKTFVIGGPIIEAGYVYYAAQLQPEMDSFNGTGTLCQITLKIVQFVSYAVPEVSCDLTFTNVGSDTFLLNNQGADIPFIIVHGFYDYVHSDKIRPRVCVDPEVTLVNQDETFSINVNVYNVTYDLWVWQIWLIYNSTVLTATAVAGAGNQIAVFAIGSDYVAVGGYYNASATLCQITFRAIGSGTSYLDFLNPTPYPSDTFLLNHYGYDIPFYALNGEVSARALRDVAVIGVDSAKTVIGLGYCDNVTVTAQNQGYVFTESFNVTTYVNATISTVTNFTLTNNMSEAKICVWNTSGSVYGNYTLTSVADTVPEETDTSDNTYVCSIPVHVGVPGDISGPTVGVYDGTTNMRDIQYLILLFNTNPSSPNWKPNADINNDGTVNMRDITIAILNFNKHE
jgi:hypothetical protein